MTVAYKSDFKIQEQVVASTVDFGVINMHKFLNCWTTKGIRTLEELYKKKKAKQ